LNRGEIRIGKLLFFVLVLLYEIVVVRFENFFNHQILLAAVQKIAEGRIIIGHTVFGEVVIKFIGVVTMVSTSKLLNILANIVCVSVYPADFGHSLE
jgi:hypothetical protein